MSSDVRTPITEVERILASMDRHFKHEMRGEDIGKMGLMDHAVSPMMRNPEKADEVVQQWDRARKSNPVEIPTYLGHVLLVCACCVQSVILHDAGKLNESWSKVMDAQIYSGIALSMYVSKHEVKHKRVKVAKSGGNNRGKKNDVIRAFVLSEWATGNWTRPGTAGTNIALRFIQPYSNPELRLADYGVAKGQLSEDSLGTRFAEWIREDEEKKLKKTLAKQSGS